MILPEIKSTITLLGIVATGAVWVGTIGSDVRALKEESPKAEAKVEEVQKEVKENSVLLAGIKARQEALLRAQETQDKKLDKILEKLEN